MGRGQCGAARVCIVPRLGTFRTYCVSWFRDRMTVRTPQFALCSAQRASEAGLSGPFAKGATPCCRSPLRGFAIEASHGRIGTVVDHLFDYASWRS